MTRPGNHNNPHLYPGHHNLVQSNPCEHVICGPNEVCVEGCCECIAGYGRNNQGKCVPLEDDTDGRPVSQFPILQETGYYIYTEDLSVICYDPYDPNNPGPTPPVDPCEGVTCRDNEVCLNGVCIPDPTYDPCKNVVCEPNEVCSKGICIPDPNYNPCLGVLCPPGYFCINGNCVRNDLSTGITQEDEGLIFNEDNLILNYDD